MSLRTQTRTTSTAGDPVADQYWTITSDTGAIPLPTNIDKFGIKMLYPTKTNGETWFFNPDTLVSKTDPHVITEISTSELHKNTDGSIKVLKSTEAENRFYITTSGGYNHSACSQSWPTNLARGYMENPQDWRNVEITSLVKINSVFTVSGHSLVWYARGGRHSTSYPCEGSAYKGNIGYNLESRFQKESGHPNYSTTSWKTLPSPLSFGKWFGYKTAIYDHNGGVKLEIWLDTTLTGNWVKVNEIFDNGTSWGSSNSCGTNDQMFLWGGPLTTFRFDSTKDIDFNKMSVREITA